MANNNNLFNAALAGAAAGVSSRVIQSSEPAVYESQATLIASFATALDAAIAPIVGGGSRGQAEVVSEISAAFWRDRILPPGTSFEVAAVNLAALYEALSPFILPDSGGGGGGDITPLSNALVVDPDGTGATPDGAWSGAQAFTSLEEGVTAVPLNGALYLCVADYSGEDPLSFEEKGCSLIGMTAQGGMLNVTPVILPNIDWTSSGDPQTIAFMNVQAPNLDGVEPWALTFNAALGATTNPACLAQVTCINGSRFEGFCNDLETDDSEVGSVTTASGMTLERSTLLGELQAGGTLTIQDCILGTNVTIVSCNALEIRGTVEGSFQEINVTTTAVLNNTHLTGPLVAGGNVQARQSRFFLNAMSLDGNGEFVGCEFETDEGGLTITVGVTEKTLTFIACTFEQLVTIATPGDEGDNTTVVFDLQSWESFLAATGTITGEFSVIVQGQKMLARTLTADGVPVADDGDPHNIISNVYPKYDVQGFQGLGTCGVTITPDNPVETPNGTLTILDPNSGFSEISWGPIPAGESVYVSLSHWGTQNASAGEWFLQVTVATGTGDVTCELIHLKVEPAEPAAG